MSILTCPKPKSKKYVDLIQSFRDWTTDFVGTVGQVIIVSAEIPFDELSDSSCGFEVSFYLTAGSYSYTGPVIGSEPVDRLAVAAAGLLGNALSSPTSQSTALDRPN